MIFQLAFSCLNNFKRDLIDLFQIGTKYEILQS